MEHGEWAARWSAGRIGFHLGKPHELLVRHLELFAGARSVLVPLAGKTSDLDLLATKTPRVLANEFVEAGARAYFAERNLIPRERRDGTTLVLEHGPVTYLVDDFFELAAAAYDAWFDRAALVAVRPQDRERYAATLGRLIRPGGVGLLVTVEYAPRDMDGPPFSLTPVDVHGLFATAFGVTELPATDAASGIRMDQVGGRPVRERCYRLERRGP